MKERIARPGRIDGIDHELHGHPVPLGQLGETDEQAGTDGTKPKKHDIQGLGAIRPSGMGLWSIGHFRSSAVVEAALGQDDGEWGYGGAALPFRIYLSEF